MTAPNSQAVPILDLKAQYKQIGPAVEEAVLNVLRSGNYILGQLGVKLEQEVAAICGTKYGVGVANGTDALILALWAANIGPGDEVITPSFTFAATAEAIALRGATPVFVEVDPLTFNINPDLIEAAITPKTKAIIPVHLYGQPCDMDPILEISKRHKLIVIEDNAQAIGATYKGRPTGSMGDMACISFYPTKNLGAAGDAGMIVSNNPVLVERLKALRAHGSKTRYYHDELGVNSRLDEIQAAVLLCKVPALKSWSQQRNQVATWYTEAFAKAAGITTPQISSESTHVWHQYTICLDAGKGSALSRDEIVKELAAAGIGSMCYYPVPLHLQAAFANFGYKQGDLPISEALARQVLSLPMYPELSQQQVQTVATTLINIVSAKLATTPAVTPMLTGV